MMIFVSSVGRSGTRYLSELFSYVSEIKGHHIPHPQCAGKVLNDYNNFIENKTLRLKRETIKNSIVAGKYFESSQLFMRCFVEEVFELRKETQIPIGVIHLIRDPLECARSYTNRKSDPGHPRWRWRPSVNIKRNFLKIEEKGLTLYQKNLWDWFENEIRYHNYKSKFDKVYNHHFINHNNYDKLREMFNFFEVNINENKLKNAISKKNIPRGENPQPTIVSQEDIEQAREFISLLHGRNLGQIFDSNIYQNYEILKNIK